MARSLAVLKLSPRIKNVITFAQNVASALAGNPHFPTPNPPLATFQADVAALNTAETAVLLRTKGSVEARDAKLMVVRTDLENLKTYVQSVAAVATPTDADAIIESSGLTIRKVTLHDKPALAAKQGSVSGTVTLAAKAAAKRASYVWQYSTDQKTWTTVPATLQSKTGISGLTAGTPYYFRVQPVTGAGVGDWSQLISLIVK
jgi:Fibronectin type III domain